MELVKRVNVPEGSSGPWSVECFELGPPSGLDLARAAIRQHGRYVPEGKYTALRRNGNVIMSDTPDELRDHMGAISQATGRCLINGLGLGLVLANFLAKQDVTHVDVIELSEDVINLVGPTYSGDPRVNIIHHDALTYKPPRGAQYDCVWHDIWDDICTDNLETMAVLHRKYGRRAAWQGSWVRHLLLLQRRREKQEWWYRAA